MKKFFVLLSAIVASALLSTGAEARHRHVSYAAHPDCNVLWPCEGVSPSPRGIKVQKAMGGFGSPVLYYTPKFTPTASVKNPRVRTRAITGLEHKPPSGRGSSGVLNYGSPSPSIAYSIARPLRYIGGRLICAINVNAALAERGIRGTGSARALSFDSWGHASPVPVPGAVAVTNRAGRGNGHVAIVSRVEGSRVFVWNPGSRGRGWSEVEYTHRHARYRVAGG